MVFQGSSRFGWQESLTIVPTEKLYGLLIVAKISEIQTRQDVPRTNSRPGKVKGLLPFSATIKDTICLKARLAQMSFQRLGLFTDTWRQK